MDDGVIDATTSETDSCHYSLGISWSGENIEGKGMLPVLYEPNGFFCIRILENWKKRAENLFLHHRVLRRYSHHYSGLDLKSFIISSSAKHNFILIYKREYPIIVLLVDDLSIVRVF